MSDQENNIYTGMKDIASRIESIKTISVEELNDGVPSANLQLEEVVSATEDATNEILDATEEIQNIINNCTLSDGEKSAVMDQTMKIFEASNFQDITGQRVSRVIQTLLEIEKTIHAILDGKDIDSLSAEPRKEAVISGPQLADDTPNQDDIDKIFSDG